MRVGATMVGIDRYGVEHAAPFSAAKVAKTARYHRLSMRVGEGRRGRERGQGEEREEGGHTCLVRGSFGLGARAMVLQAVALAEANEAVRAGRHPFGSVL